jgi:hypothetical protein
LLGTVDVENSTILWLIATNRSVRTALGLGDSYEVRFISSGDKSPRRPNELSVDAGGGAYDQHVQPENVAGTQVTSLELVLRAALDGTNPWLWVLYNGIISNDATGMGLVRGNSIEKMRQESKYPHSDPELRTLLKAMVLTNNADPARVIDWFFLALNGVKELIETEYESELIALAQKLGDGTPEYLVAVQMLENEEMPTRKRSDIFILPTIVEGVKLYLANVHRYAPEKATARLAAFEQDADAALAVWEAEWTVAQKDAEEARVEIIRDSFYRQRVVEEMDGRQYIADVRGPVVLIAGISDSERYSQVLRRKARKLFRAECRGEPQFVIIQFMRSSRKFFVSSNNMGGVVLDDAAAAIRIMDMVARGGTPVSNDPQSFGEIGGCPIKVQNGSPCTTKVIEPIYFPFPTGFGNRLVTNPFMPESPLTPDQVWDTVRDVLLSRTASFPDRADGRPLPCHRGPASFCDPQCVVRSYQHISCRAFRNEEVHRYLPVVP